MRRRTLLAGTVTAAAPALAGCSPCGETWPSVAFDVTPTVLERQTDGWRVDAEVTVAFNFGTEAAGVRGAALAAFAADGRLLGATDLGDLLWSDVSESDRTEDDCGAWGTLRRPGTVAANAFPRWVGLRYDRSTEPIDQPHSVARYPSATLDTEPSAERYESIALPVEPDVPRPIPESEASTVDFDRRGDSCRADGAEVRFDRGVDVRWHRDLPAPRYHPILSEARVRDGRAALDVGLAAWPRFRRLRCRRQGYRATVAVSTADAGPVDSAVVRHLDPSGEPVATRTFRRPDERTPTHDGADSAG